MYSKNGLLYYKKKLAQMWKAAVKEAKTSSLSAENIFDIMWGNQIPKIRRAYRKFNGDYDLDLIVIKSDSRKK